MSSVLINDKPMTLMKRKPDREKNSQAECSGKSSSPDNKAECSGKSSSPDNTAECSGKSSSPDNNEAKPAEQQRRLSDQANKKKRKNKKSKLAAAFSGQQGADGSGTSQAAAMGKGKGGGAGGAQNDSPKNAKKVGMKLASDYSKEDHPGASTQERRGSSDHPQTPTHSKFGTGFGKHATASPAELPISTDLCEIKFPSVEQYGLWFPAYKDIEWCYEQIMPQFARLTVMRKVDPAQATDCANYKKVIIPIDTNSLEFKVLSCVRDLERAKSDLKQSPAHDQRNNRGRDKRRPKDRDMQRNVNPSQVLDLRHLSNEELTVFLKAEFIYPLDKPNPRFPDASWFCRICDYHVDRGWSHAAKHICVADHNRNKMQREMSELLSCIPQPSPAHKRSIGRLVLDATTQRGRCPRDREVANMIAESLTTLFRERIHPECHVRLYGSVLSGFALENSNVNFELVFPTDTMAHYDAFERMEAVLEEESTNADRPACNVMADCSKPRCYVVKFDWVCSSDKMANCVISVLNTQAHQVNTLLWHYTQLWPDLCILGQALRLWARMCKLDNVVSGGVPAYAFDLMLVHYLQRCEPAILPCLHEFDKLSVDLKSEDSGVATEDQGSSDGVVTVAEYNPDTYTRDLGRVTAAFPPPKYEDDESRIEFLGGVWIDLVRFYALGACGYSNRIICIDTLSDVRRDAKGWNQKRLGVADPFLLKKNVGNMAALVYDFFQHCLLTSFLYFGVPQICSNEQQSAKPLFKYERRRLVLLDDAAPNVSGRPDSPYTHLKSQLGGTVMVQLPAESEEEAVKRVVERAAALEESQLRFDFFHPANYQGSMKPVLVCLVCSRKGHTEPDCPDMKLPSIRVLPSKGNARFDDLMNQLLINCKNEYCISPQREVHQNTIRSELERVLPLHHRCFDGVSLTLFGSSCNGFGFNTSDLDICMTFPDRCRPPDELESKQLIRRLASVLRHRNLRAFDDIVPVTRARVPIVKFSVSLQTLGPIVRFEGDVSLYNRLGMRNTKLLQTYVNIDNRFQTLGYAIKLLAKHCQIGDASHGTLSSYAYIIMLIHFLQRCDPPVLPSLQQVYPDGVKPDRPDLLIDGYDSYFYEGTPPGFPEKENTDSVYELWMKFLGYYTETFDFDRHVVCIRRLKPLSKFEKCDNQWDRKICIEDPFNLDHNLSSGLSKRMATYIRKCFHRARDVFGVSMSDRQLQNVFGSVSHPSLFAAAEQHFFLERLARDLERPPKDNVCRICGHVAHFVEQCPYRRANRDKARKQGAAAAQTLNTQGSDEDTDLEEVPEDQSFLTNFTKALSINARHRQAGDVMNTASTHQWPMVHEAAATGQPLFRAPLPLRVNLCDSHVRMNVQNSMNPAVSSLMERYSAGGPVSPVSPTQPFNQSYSYPPIRPNVGSPQQIQGQAPQSFGFYSVSALFQQPAGNNGPRPLVRPFMGNNRMHAPRQFRHRPPSNTNDMGPPPGLGPPGY